MRMRPYVGGLQRSLQDGDGVVLGSNIVERFGPAAQLSDTIPNAYPESPSRRGRTISLPMVAIWEAGQIFLVSG